LLLCSSVAAQNGPILSIEDSPHYVSDNSIHQFNVRIDNANGLFAFSIHLIYDHTAIDITALVSYDFLSTTGANTISQNSISTPGLIILDESILGIDPEMTSSGRMFTIFYRAVQQHVQKEVPLIFDVCLLRDEYNNPIQRTTIDGMIYLYYGRVRVKAWLQGPYDATAGAMHTQLRDYDYAAQRDSPFTQDPLSFPMQLPQGVVDWVLVQLRDGVTGAILQSRSCFLRSDGLIVAPSLSAAGDIPFAVAAGDYYIIVRHRNHLGVQSSAAYTVGYSSATVYDFTQSQGAAYGISAMAGLGTGGVAPFGMYAGDTNGDGEVNALDRSNTWNLRNVVTFTSTDCNIDGEVNALDRSMTWNNRNVVTQIP